MASIVSGDPIACTESTLSIPVGARDVSFSPNPCPAYRGGEDRGVCPECSSDGAEFWTDGGWGHSRRLDRAGLCRYANGL